MKTFETIEQLHEEWKVNGACDEGIEFNHSCKTLQEVFETCPLKFRLWRLQKGYFQFAEHDVEKISSEDWCWLLCNQPTLIDRCPIEKISGYDWRWILRYQPELIDRCPVEKLSGEDWGWILRSQPQLEKFKPENIKI